MTNVSKYSHLSRVLYDKCLAVHIVVQTNAPEYTYLSSVLYDKRLAEINVCLHLPTHTRLSIHTLVMPLMLAHTCAARDQYICRGQSTQVSFMKQQHKDRIPCKSPNKSAAEERVTTSCSTENQFVLIMC
jgi:hypothetical protein